MTVYRTFGDLQTQVEQELDMQDENFVTPAEFMGYFNRAVKACESAVHTIYEDYFLTRATIAMVNAQEEYALPTDIYAFKIRSLIYKNGTTVYPVERVRDWKKMLAYTTNQINGSELWYRYFLINETAGSKPKILLTPNSRETGAFLTLWYLRSANRMTSIADTMDIPEANEFVMNFVRACAYEKDGNPNLALALAERDASKADLVSTLAAMNPDSNNQIEADLSFYLDHT